MQTAFVVLSPKATVYLKVTAASVELHGYQSDTDSNSRIGLDMGYRLFLLDNNLVHVGMYLFVPCCSPKRGQHCLMLPYTYNHDPSPFHKVSLLIKHIYQMVSQYQPRPKAKELGLNKLSWCILYA